MGTPSAPAFCQSTSTRYSGTSSMPFGRTLVRRLSWKAMPRSWLRASISLWWPSPPRSSNWKSNPVPAPSSTTAGGGKANTRALRCWENAAMALPATAFTLRSDRFLRFQSFSLTNTMPLFCALPEKPIPEIVIIESTASFSLSRKCFCTALTTSWVCSMVEPDGNMIWASIMPWSSSGT